MKREEFEEIKSKLKDYQYSSMEYAEYEEVMEYEILCMNLEMILVSGYNPEAKEREYHWAANKSKDLIQNIKKEGLVTFIPHAWVPEMEQEGFVVRNAWHEYFLKSMESIGESAIETELLEKKDCKEASEVTMTCRGLSRGFTGQTEEWFLEWLSQDGDYAQNRTVFIERDAEGKIKGLVCTGTYGHDSEKGAVSWIREAAVRPEYQNQGVARRLINQALYYGKCHGATRGFLAADEQNAGAIHLYESIGFEASEEESQIDMRKCGNREEK